MKSYATLSVIWVTAGSFFLFTFCAGAFANEVEIIDYATVNLVTVEKTHQIKLKPKVVTLGDKTIEMEPEAHVFGQTKNLSSLQPRKGEHALIIVAKVQNKGNRYIFERVMPGYIMDTKGEIYREEGDAIEGKLKKGGWHTEILVKKLG